MARRQKGTLDELMQLLSEMPWWVSLAVAATVFVAVKFILPAMWPDPRTLPGAFAAMVSQLAWLSVIFVLPGVKSFFGSTGKRRVLDGQSGIESIRRLPWKQFEELLGEAYRRQGFTVFENAGKGADGGVDLTIKRGGETYLVQCKHWKTYKVGVKVVREMLGLATAHRATGAIVVTSGVFTKEASAFAASQHVTLVDGHDLLGMIRGVQVRPSIPMPSRPPIQPPATRPAPATAPVASPQSAAARVCPSCGQPMVLRTAKRGANAGHQFYGCSSYPKCRQIVEIAQA